MAENEKIKEALAVLDLPKEEQLKWLLKNLDEPARSYLAIGNSLADLAFWMRDEIAELHSDEWYKAKSKIYNYIKKFPHFWDIWSKPIHWIINAIIAKILAEVTK